MERFEIDTIVIGAGAVGLACGVELARKGTDVFVFENENTIGAGCSSRNSEVAHTGIYYARGSLKHLACTEGQRRLYRYLDERGVSYKKCGKLIVATDWTEEGKLTHIHRRALENGVEKLEFLSRRGARALEPALECVAAMLSPETGIFDSHAYLLALSAELEDFGGRVVLSTHVDTIEPLAQGGFSVWTGGREPICVNCRQLVNSAGLFAQSVARRIEGFPSEHIPPIHLAKGSYFSYGGTPVFSRLIYPVPADGGLGVHITLDLAGRMRFGPDVEWLSTTNPTEVDYSVDLRRADGFYSAVRRYWPNLPDGAIGPDYSGCRPKLSGPGQPAVDFRVDGAETHGVEGLLNLFGIESPGLTSSLSLAKFVGDKLEGRVACKYRETAERHVKP